MYGDKIRNEEICKRTQVTDIAKSIAENEKQKIIWENYLQNLKKLDFSTFLDKMKVPSLIPIGNRIMFRGELIHTNEVTVALGANYFVKCSVKQANVIKQHRIKVADEKLQILQKERDYLENHLSFSQQNILEELGKEIIEPFEEQEELEWRKKHRESVRKTKQENKCSEILNISDNDLWERLEELELKEELENELNESPEASRLHKTDIHSLSQDTGPQPMIIEPDNFTEKHSVTNVLECTQSSRGCLNELRKRLSEIQSEQESCTTEADVFKRLEQLEEQERLEEEIDRLENDEVSNVYQSDDEDITLKPSKKSISFASDYEGDCIEIHFKHDEFSPDFKKYNTNDGIQKPSDIYLAFPENFKKESIIPILKKTEHAECASEKNNCKEDIQKVAFVEPRRVNIVGEVVEKTDEQKVTTYVDRPPSKFKLMRMKKNNNCSH